MVKQRGQVFILDTIRYHVKNEDPVVLAAGRFDGFWELKLSPWDTAAGWLSDKSDKKSLFMGGTIIEVALCVKGKMTPTYVVFRNCYGEKLGKDTKAREAASSSDEIYWKLGTFWLDADTVFHGIPCPLFQEIMRCKPQWNNPDPCKDSPHREEPENRSNLYGHLVVVCWL